MHRLEALKDRPQSFAKASAALGPAYVFEDGATYSHLSGHQLLSPMPADFKAAIGMLVHGSAGRQQGVMMMMMRICIASTEWSHSWICISLTVILKCDAKVCKR